MANRNDPEHSLIEGLLESLITEELQRRLSTAHELDAHIEGLDQADEPHVLARHLARVVETELSGRKPETRTPDIGVV